MAGKTKKKKIDSYLGFARKAGKLTAGTSKCLSMASKGKLKLLIITRDMASGSAKKLVKTAAAENIPYRIYGTSDHIGEVTGCPGRAVFGITDDEFADLISDKIEEELREKKEVLI